LSRAGTDTVIPGEIKAKKAYRKVIGIKEYYNEGIVASPLERERAS
jgi:hypothetical protein